MNQSNRWVLAFDSGCGKCRQVADAVEQACSGKLELLPLTDTDVRRWRRSALGEDPAWRPTLLRVAGPDVRAWTGVRMAAPLMRVLGARCTVAVLRSLGELGAEHRDAERGHNADGSRRGFFRVGAGALAIGGMMVLGRTPAFAHSENSAARQWVRAQGAALPKTYHELTQHSVARRRAVFVASTPAKRSAFWSAHLHEFRATHPQLDAQQSAVLDEAQRLFGSASTFASHPHRDAALDSRLTRLRAAAVSAYGEQDAFALLGRLGPDDGVHITGNCNCSSISDYCGGGQICVKHFDPACDDTCCGYGCGTGLLYACDGECS